MKHIYYVNGKKKPKKFAEMIMGHVTSENFTRYAGHYSIEVCTIGKNGITWEQVL